MALFTNMLIIIIIIITVNIWRRGLYAVY